LGRKPGIEAIQLNPHPINFDDDKPENEVLTRLMTPPVKDLYYVFNPNIKIYWQIQKDLA
jgi:hypothetical protein